MSWKGLLVVAVGATLGAWLRWGLALRWNDLWPGMPLGTLAANLLGGYLVGVVVAGLIDMPQLAPEWRLLLVTGFLGGLTTFSTFSAEVVAMLLRTEYLMGLLTAMAHVCGSLLMTMLGMLSWRALV